MGLARLVLLLPLHSRSEKLVVWLSLWRLDNVALQSYGDGRCTDEIRPREGLLSTGTRGGKIVINALTRVAGPRGHGISFTRLGRSIKQLKVNLS